MKIRKQMIQSKYNSPHLVQINMKNCFGNLILVNHSLLSHSQRIFTFPVLISAQARYSQAQTKNKNDAKNACKYNWVVKEPKFDTICDR